MTGLLLAFWQIPAPAAAARLNFQVKASEPVQVTGTPAIALTVGDQQRAARYVSGDRTDTLTFAYDVLPRDFDADGVQLGSAITGGGFTDLAGNPPAGLTLTPPDSTGVKVQNYVAAFATSPITPQNASAISFTVTNAPQNATFTYRIASSAGGAEVSGSGTIGAAVTTVSNVNVTAMLPGTLTLSVTVTYAPGGGTGATVTATATATPQGVLDSLGTSASAAFSTRLLRSAYSGPLLRVRRSSDGGQANIGATIGGLDTAALASYCSGTSCFVTTWYDQSGSGNDAAQATATDQPLIATGGTVESHNSRPALRLNGSSSNLNSFVSFGTSYTLNIVASRAAGSTSYRRLLNVGGASRDTRLFLGVLNDDYTTFAGNSVIWRDTAANSPVATISTSSSPVTMTVTVGSGDLVPYINGSAQTLKNGATVASPELNIGARYGNSNSQLWNGRVSEVLVFGSVLSGSQLSTLQQSQKAYFGTP